jgi:pilus assembly protein CpaB
MAYRVRNIVIAGMLALLAALLTAYYVTSYKQTVQKAEDEVTVLVASKDIPAGTAADDVVAQGLVSRHKIERRQVVQGAITSLAQVEGLVATQAIYQGEQITTRRFSPLEQQGIRGQLEGNMRAVQVPGDPNQLLAGVLKPGDRIDVVASLRYKVADVATADGLDGDVERVASRVILRDIEVLKSGAAGTASKLSTGPQGSHSVVLAVSDTQSQKLFFALKNGDWTLQLRPVIDAADSPESVETIESVLGDGLKDRQYRQLYAGKDVR